MDVGATSLGKGTGKIVESSTTLSSPSSDSNVQQIANSLQESVATSRLSSLLSSLVAEPLAAAPRMPQQHSPRGTSVGEKAPLPQSVSPSFPIPPHIMGRNVNNPVEDIVAHGRRLQKPRLGVKVPYRNLTSQIVTQEELAQELFERSLKKYPVHDVPEGGDLFFTIKLTQRLANRLSPGNTQASVASQSNQSPGKSSQSQQQTEANCALQSKAAETTAIRDHKDLLAILEGDGDPDWAPVPPAPAAESAVSSVEHSSSQHSASHITNAKLDPVLEKELALKQLMEFQTNSRRRKSDKVGKTGEKPRRPRAPNKKQPLNKENGAVGNKMVISKVDSENNNSRTANVLHSGVSNSTAKRTPSSNPAKATRKRKLEDSVPTSAKKSRVSGKKSAGQNKDESKAIVRVKTEGKVHRKLKAPKNLSPNNNNNSAALNVSVTKVKGHSVTVVKQVSSTKSMSDSKPKKSTSPAVDGRKKSPNASEGSNLNKSKQSIDSLQASQGSSVAHSSSIADDLPEFSRSFTTPIRTYSPKKRTPNATAAPKVQSPDTLPRPKIESSSPEGTSVAKPKEAKVADAVKVSPSSPQKQSSDNVASPRKKKDAKDSIDSKRRRMGEVDRLLMDEGAINLLYEAEHGESRRRSNIPEEIESAPPPPRRILKSVRRKKKDLLLKTRLVKNAVLRLSASPSPATVAARITRRADTLTLQSASADNATEPHRKLSLDSRESLKSPPPLTPNDPPSPQSFIYPGRLPLPAEASRIIRRHSSSSNFSSRSASPNTNRVSDALPNSENAEKAQDVSQSSISSEALAGTVKSGGQASEGRKKGVPIFIRKPPVIHTYQVKRKKVLSAESKSSDISSSAKSSNKTSSQNKDLKAAPKVQPSSAQKIAADKKRAPGMKKISISDKLKIKADMSKNFQKGFPAGKLKTNSKKSVDSASTKSKKKDEAAREKLSKGEAVASTSAGDEIIDETPDLTSCLAAAASAFAAEVQEAREEKAARKALATSGASHTSSPCPSRSSKSPTPTSKTGSKKEAKLAAPLSPNAATYSNLLKTLESESQKQRKKDGEEATKQRSSVRQNAGTYHYKDISLRRYDNLVQVILTPQSTKMKNALNLQVLRELKDALHQLKKDESCRAVLLTSTGSSFCQGIDFYSLLHTNVERRKSSAQELAQALKDFLKSLALFNKPIVAGVHGAAVGLGVTMLPFFDMVFASDKATFYTPYAKLGQVPEGAAILTLPHMFGNAVTSELLFGCRKLTASEALHFGLVTRILWPDRFQEELIPVIRGMANQSSQSMEATKALLRHSLRTKLDAALESETHLLVQHWISAECQANFRKFLDDEDVGLQKQRVEA